MLKEIYKISKPFASDRLFRRRKDFLYDRSLYLEGGGVYTFSINFKK